MLEPAQERLLQIALKALENNTGIRHRIAENDGGQLVTLLIPIGKDREPHDARYLVRVKAIARPVPPHALEADTNDNETHYRMLLVAPRITEATGAALRHRGQDFLDAAGNAHLHAANYLVLVAGMRTKGADIPLGKEGVAITAAALKIVFALLCEPDLLNAPYRAIAQAANVALGAVGPVLADLQRRQFIATDARKQRRLIDPIRLIDEWVTNYPLRLRPKLHPRRFAAQDSGWRDDIDLTDYGAWWGGEIAADRYTQYLRPATTTIYQRPRREDLTRLIARARLRPDPTGDIEVLDAFWNLPTPADDPDVVPPLLAYADLLQSLDPRNIEVAQRLYRERIEDVFADA